jgi:hypothetical protein
VGIIKNIANTVGDVTKAGATTTSSISQIVDLVKQRKAKQTQAASQAPQVLQVLQVQAPTPQVPPVVSKALQVPLALQVALNQKSIDILKNLIAGVSSGSVGATGAHATLSTGSVGVTGAGFKVVPGRGYYLKQ